MLPHLSVGWGRCPVVVIVRLRVWSSLGSTHRLGATMGSRASVVSVFALFLSNLMARGNWSLSRLMHFLFLLKFFRVLICDLIEFTLKTLLCAVFTHQFLVIIFTGTLLRRLISVFNWRKFD